MYGAAAGARSAKTWMWAMTSCRVPLVLAHALQVLGRDLEGGAHLVQGLGRDVHPELTLGLGQRQPQPAPGGVAMSGGKRRSISADA